MKSWRSDDIWACSTSGLAPAQKIVLRDLRLRDEGLDRGETRADLESAGLPLGHLHG